MIYDCLERARKCWLVKKIFLLGKIARCKRSYHFKASIVSIFSSGKFLPTAGPTMFANRIEFLPPKTSNSHYRLFKSILIRWSVCQRRSPKENNRKKYSQENLWAPKFGFQTKDLRDWNRLDQKVLC